MVAPATAALASLEIQLDGHTIGNAGWSMPLPIDPGDHMLRATAEGKKSFETKVTVPKGLGLTDANVPALEDAPKPIVVPAPPPPPANEPPPSNTQRTVGFVVGGAGVVGALVGAAFGFRAISLKGDRDARCNAQGTLCDSEGIDKDGKARDVATASTIAFIAGGALLAGGAVLIFTAPKKKSVGARTLNVGFNPTNIVFGGAFGSAFSPRSRSRPESRHVRSSSTSATSRPVRVRSAARLDPASRSGRTHPESR